jgi:hypothetical protein
VIARFGRPAFFAGQARRTWPLLRRALLAPSALAADADAALGVTTAEAVAEATPTVANTATRSKGVSKWRARRGMEGPYLWGDDDTPSSDHLVVDLSSGSWRALL